MRKIGIMIGSESDLGQCIYGLRFLSAAESLNQVKIAFVRINSIHRNTSDVLSLLQTVNQAHMVDALIIGAGLANHLTGTCDAYLRYALRNPDIVVFGVAFFNQVDPEAHIASLSIEKVPGTQVVFNNYAGPDGFLRACQDSINSPLPKINIPATKPIRHLTLGIALELAEK